MKSTRILLIAGALCLGLGAGPVASAAQGSEDVPARPEQQPDGMLDGLVEHLMSTLRGLLRAIPQYEMPEINENGDIIIRRKHPEPEPGETGRQSEAVET